MSIINKSYKPNMTSLFNGRTADIYTKKMEQKRIEEMLKYIIPENGPICLDLISPKLLEMSTKEPIVCIAMKEEEYNEFKKRQTQHKNPIIKLNSTEYDEDLYN
jgi:hypothetical protein